MHTAAITNKIYIHDLKAEVGTVQILEADACYLLRGLPGWIVTCNVERTKNALDWKGWREQIARKPIP